MPLPAQHLRKKQAAVKTVPAPQLSLRGAKRRGNLVQAVTFSPGVPCYPAGYCEIAPQGHFLALRAQGATAPLGPRNDNSKPLHVRRCRSTTCDCQRRLLSAATDAIGFHVLSPALYELQVPSRDCHVASLLGMPRQGGAAVHQCPCAVEWFFTMRSLPVKGTPHP